MSVVIYHKQSQRKNMSVLHGMYFMKINIISQANLVNCFSSLSGSPSTSPPPKSLLPLSIMHTHISMLRRPGIIYSRANICCSSEKVVKHKHKFLKSFLATDSLIWSINVFLQFNNE